MALMGRASTLWLKSIHCWSSGLAPSPAGRPVFEAMTRAKRSGWNAQQVQPGEPAPVLAVERDVGEVLAVEPLAHPVDVGGDGVVAAGGGLVGAAHAHEVEGHDPVTPPDQAADHVPVEVAPRRVAVQQQHRGGVARALVDEVEPQGGAVGGGDLAVVRLEVVPVEPLEALVGSAQDIHGNPQTGRRNQADEIVATVLTVVGLGKVRSSPAAARLRPGAGQSRLRRRMREGVIAASSGVSAGAPAKRRP